MKERGIIFNAEMVRAIMDGRKAQTRRPLKYQNIRVENANYWRDGDWHPTPFVKSTWPCGTDVLMSAPFGTVEEFLADLPRRCPYGQPGERLWVRETWAQMCGAGDAECHCENGFPENEHHYIEYRADTGNPRPGDWPEPTEDEYQDAPTWRPSIHMPRKFSRITLEITGVRVERVQEISQSDVFNEGFCSQGKVRLECCEAHDWFKATWDRIYSKQGLGWDANPWVWVVEFMHVE